MGVIAVLTAAKWGGPADFSSLSPPKRRLFAT